MGNDGGSIPDRRDLVRSKPKAEQADKANQTRARWFLCALSKRPLQEPVVSCALGKLYNKDAIIEYILDKNAYGDGEEICGHIRTIKDVKPLKLTHNAAKAKSNDDSADRASFVCPLNLKEMNGAQPFVYLWTCGCVFSQSGLRAVSSTPPPREDNGKLDEKAKDKDDTEPKDQLDLCPQCATKYHRTGDVILLNPPPEEEEKMFAAMLKRRAAEPKKSKKRKAAAVAESDAAEPSAKKKHASPVPSINSSIATASRAVAQSLAEEESKRKAGMSDAVKSLYGPKDGSKKKETFMTMGTFTRYA